MAVGQYGLGGRRGVVRPRPGELVPEVPGTAVVAPPAIGQTDPVADSDSSLTPEQRDRLIEILRSGAEVPREWQRIVFPPGKRECELVYDGKDRAEEVISETMGLPLQPVRTFGRNGDGWSNMLVFGDNLQVLRTLLEKKRQGELCCADGTPGVRLAYIDPPFATKREFRGQQNAKAYQDKVVGSQFLEFLRKRLILLRELLTNDGVIFVHSDWKKGHYIKVLLDEVFGEHRFRNEIIWWYYNKMQGNVKRFPSNHENIFFYSAGSEFSFNALQEERIGGNQRLLKREWDPNTQRLVNAKGPDGKVIYIETDHKRIDDVWRISMLQPADRSENLRYPTQKPETLLSLIVEAASNPGDLVLDCFAGSGTTAAVAEKLGRRWVTIDCGKLSMYMIQRRMLNLRADIGNKSGDAHSPAPFTLYNAGLYDFSRLSKLPWEDWRFFALQLFQCKDAPHRLGGIQLDGTLKGSDVLVFNHYESAGAKVTYETVEDIHQAIGNKVGSRFFIIAPALCFSFQEDYVDLDGTRYYALRIPYSIIHELHRREFMAIRQPADEVEINATVDAVGFDFIRTPEAKVTYRLVKNGSPDPKLTIRVTTFKSEPIASDPQVLGNLESLSMLLLDTDYDGSVFNMSHFYFADQVRDDGHTIRIPLDEVGGRLMLVLVDIFGNEFREVREAEELGIPERPQPSARKKSEAKKKMSASKGAAKKKKKTSSRKASGSTSRSKKASTRRQPKGK